MALAPMNSATKPITSKGLFNAAGGQSFEDFKATAGADTPMPSIAPAQVDDSVANKVNSLTSQNSALMQAAKTEGLKTANRRGLMNSSIAAGASQDAALRYALPIASQDASQDFQRNQGARAFEYGMAAQDSAQGFQGGQAALDRALQESLQSNQITAAEQQQIRDIASREGLASAERALQERMQGTAIAEQQRAQGADIDFRNAAQDKEIAYQTAERNLDRGLQEKLATWNLNSSDRNAAAQFLTSMESMYQSSYQSIMNNTSLDAKTRTAQLTSAKNLRDRQIDFVQQLYDVKLEWGQAKPKTPAKPATDANR